MRAAMGCLGRLGAWPATPRTAFTARWRVMLNCGGAPTWGASQPARLKPCFTPRHRMRRRRQRRFLAVVTIESALRSCPDKRERRPAANAIHHNHQLTLCRARLLCAPMADKEIPTLQALHAIMFCPPCLSVLHPPPAHVVGKARAVRPARWQPSAAAHLSSLSDRECTAARPEPCDKARKLWESTCLCEHSSRPGPQADQLAWRQGTSPFGSPCSHSRVQICNAQASPHRFSRDEG